MKYFVAQYHTHHSVLVCRGLTMFSCCWLFDGFHQIDGVRRCLVSISCVRREFWRCRRVTPNPLAITNLHAVDSLMLLCLLTADPLLIGFTVLRRNQNADRYAQQTRATSALSTLATLRTFRTFWGPTYFNLKLVWDNYSSVNINSSINIIAVRVVLSPEQEYVVLVLPIDDHTPSYWCLHPDCTALLWRAACCVRMNKKCCYLFVVSFDHTIPQFTEVLRGGSPNKCVRFALTCNLQHRMVHPTCC